MSFCSPRNISHNLPNIGLFRGTSPAPVFYRGRLWVFYVGSGDDGIWYTTMGNNWLWETSALLNDRVAGISVSRGTSPSAVAYNDKLYVFYNGSGNDGTFCACYDGSSWSRIVSVAAMLQGDMGFLPDTSPSAVTYKNKLYLFWHSSRDDGIFHCTLDDGGSWNHLGGVGTPHGIALETSPAVVVYRDTLYLFWNGRGRDGTFFSTTDGNTWSSQSSVKATIQGGEMGFADGTSPAAVVLKNGRLRLLWVGSGGRSQGFWHSDFENGSWSKQVNMLSSIGNEDVGDGCSPATVVFDKFWNTGSSADPVSTSGGFRQGTSRAPGSGNMPYVFWKGEGVDLFYSYSES